MAEEIKRLYRSRKERMIGGVCGGLGEYLNIDATVVRLLAVISAFVSFGGSILAYLVMVFVVPMEPIEG
ncbi:MAG: PspC domain-containing protein [Anaerolineales bacterium]|jgi:phage shock protein C